jgi:hypothetical protein
MIKDSQHLLLIQANVIMVPRTVDIWNKFKTDQDFSDRNKFAVHTLRYTHCFEIL